MSRLSADLHNPAVIHVLPEDVASKIAAGEVVERPASVVRELVDNAIDAGARHVRIEIRAGGRELIRVTDDGCGVRPDDVPRAFLRHATSKIKTADDLWAVKTLGFRGEALFSIAAVSRMSFLSRPQDAAVGYEMVVEGGHVTSHGAKGAPLGSVVTVRDLFYNLPARLKFLKSPQAESAHITALVQQYALAHPMLRFTLTSEGRQTFQSPGDGDLRTAACCVYGTDVARAFLPVGIEPEEPDDQWDSLLDLMVYGYVSPPAHSRSNRQAMLFFVNRRAIQSRMLQYAVAEAYHSLLMVGRHPICIVHLSIAPSLLDVNVHPAKAEVKFRDERVVFSAVQKAVRSALQAHVPAPAFGSRGNEGWSLGNGATGIEAEFSTSAGYAPGLSQGREHTQADLWDESGNATASRAGDEGIEPLPPPKLRSLPPLRVVGQVGTTYIIAEGPDGLFLVDQHAAHERVLYEQLGAAMVGGSLMVQPLLTPVPLELTAHQRSMVEPVLPLLAELGFELEAFGDSALLVRAVPAIYASSNRDMGRALLELIDEVMSGTAPDRWREEMAITLACHSAIRAGQVLSLDEMRALLGQLELCHYPRSCAHGRPTMLHLSQMQLEREFGRRA
ncbi:MAG TPA: DNA mismatch repair endonuclease MutL [Chloroflexia bacterium]|nr:DNA mismatch repair endonuclease MutL [Chloroflexia bacterium]